MTREWPNGLPFDALCEECKAQLSRGTRYHNCEAYAEYLLAARYAKAQLVKPR